MPIDAKMPDSKELNMSLVLDLPAELQDQLTQDAARLGLPLAEYALRLLSVNRMAGSPPRTGAELLAYWEAADVIGGRCDISDPQSHARNLRQEVERRQRPD